MAVEKTREQREPLTLMAPISRRSEQLPAQRGRIAWRRFAPAAPEEEAKLTPREREVLDCFAAGLNTEAIATCLSISRTTVRNHAQRILAKLGVHTRLAAVARGYATGVLAVPVRKEEDRPR